MSEPQENGFSPPGSNTLRSAVNVAARDVDTNMSYRFTSPGTGSRKRSVAAPQNPPVAASSWLGAPIFCSVSRE